MEAGSRRSIRQPVAPRAGKCRDHPAPEAELLVEHLTGIAVRRLALEGVEIDLVVIAAECRMSAHAGQVQRAFDVALTEELHGLQRIVIDFRERLVHELPRQLLAFQVPCRRSEEVNGVAVAAGDGHQIQAVRQRRNAHHARLLERIAFGVHEREPALEYRSLRVADVKEHDLCRTLRALASSHSGTGIGTTLQIPKRNWRGASTTSASMCPTSCIPPGC